MREWRWAIRYYKFRGRGRGATEKTLGADGIFELALASDPRSQKKSLLFQAKMADDGGASSLLAQSIRLSTWREAAFVLVYSESNFRAIPLDDVIRSRGHLENEMGRLLVNYLAQDFLDCLVGDDELSYDGRRHVLSWRALNNQLVETKFVVRHRIRLDVDAVIGGIVNRIVSPADVHNFRMYATSEEILAGGPAINATTGITRARRHLALAYHPDTLTDLDVMLKQIVNRRMQEVNAAADDVESRAKRS